jgi:predicted RNA binding protein YcfA (HicA-like mRNA interferase family)
MVVVSGRELARALRPLGYSVVRQKGSHMTLKAPNRPTLTIPDHDPIKKGTLHSILRVVGLTEAELRALL